ncbi:MAG: TIGR04282 family arsenosugar biosynthesis glycosyltransferase [Sphingomonadales bacterium]|nr:TIGR04282 family arsenosugar biosynthesis glycosyltransferase [Sphingomonadales bacterium]
MRSRVILFGKAPLAGFAKTRLIPAVGKVGAAVLARRLLIHAIDEARAAFHGAVELCVTPSPDDPVWDVQGIRHPDLSWSEQGDGDLGARMARAAKRALANGEPVLLIGSDCPALDRRTLSVAARRLENADAVMIPALDGGYVLLGLRRYDPSLFSEIAWSTETVAHVTAERCARLGWRVDRMAPLPDIDEPSDLAHVPEQFLPVVRKEPASAATIYRAQPNGYPYDA